LKVVKRITRVPQPVYELSGLQYRHVECQFYKYELGKVTVSPETGFQIDKIVAHVIKGALNNILSSGKVTTKLLTVG
jgi:hypothetical protein